MWEKNSKKQKAYMYMHNWFTLLYTRNKGDTVNQLYSNKNFLETTKTKKYPGLLSCGPASSHIILVEVEGKRPKQMKILSWSQSTDFYKCTTSLSVSWCLIWMGGAPLKHMLETRQGATKLPCKPATRSWLHSPGWVFWSCWDKVMLSPFPS